MQSKEAWTREQKIQVAKICAYVFIGIVGITVTAIIKLAPTTDLTALLTVKPKAFIPYYPDLSEVPGQRKAQIVAELKLMEKRLANNIHVNFDIDHGNGRRVSADQWHKEIKDTPLTFSMSDPEKPRLVWWTPDIANEIENIARNRKKPFKLWLTVTWQDIDKESHKLESYSELRYHERLKLFYWDERTNRLAY